MRKTRLPSTKSTVSFKVVASDLVLAAACPFLAFFLRDPTIFDHPSGVPYIIYAVTSFGFCVATFLVFRLGAVIPKFFSFYDAVEIGKAVLIALTAASVFCFVATRLNDVPRSVPAIHTLILLVALIGVRLGRRWLSHRGTLFANHHNQSQERNVIIVGATRLSWLYIRMLDVVSSGSERVVGILDDDKTLRGRSMFGHLVIGSPSEASSLIADFMQHGVKIDALIMCQTDNALRVSTTERLRSVCDMRDVELVCFADQLGVKADASIDAFVKKASPPKAQLNGYHVAKRAIDIAISASAIVILIPLFVLITVLVGLDSGFPLVFWQKRIGRDHRPMFIYKFRTMRKPVDRNGRILSLDERRSSIGSFLRKTRFDELPQLLNVLSGSMSLIGPRPLLLVDQPSDCAKRLMVRPGITGLAQVSGGVHLTPEEKGSLDDRYVEDASVLLDLKIVYRTILTVMAGDRWQLARARQLAMEPKLQLEPAPFYPASMSFP